MSLKKAQLKTPEDRKNYFREESKTTVIRDKEIVLYTPNSLLDFFAVWGENIEPELLDWIDSLPKSCTYYDVGASNGLFSMYAHLSGMKVVAFEPDALNYSILEINKFLNNLTFDALNIAISNANHLAKLHINRFGFGTHNKILDEVTDRDGSHPSTSEYVQSVLSFSLDDFLELFSLSIPEFVKIDVDGSELRVLEGGSNFFRHVREMFIELSENHSDYIKIIQLLTEYGFKEKKRIPVRHPNGGIYENLYNVILVRE